MIQCARHEVAKVFHCRLANLQNTASTRGAEFSVQHVPLPLSALCMVGFFESEVYEKEEIADFGSKAKGCAEEFLQLVVSCFGFHFAIFTMAERCASNIRFHVDCVLELAALTSSIVDWHCECSALLKPCGHLLGWTDSECATW